MEAMLAVLALALVYTVFAIPFGVLAARIASGSDKWASEDQAQYEACNPHVKVVREKLVREASRESGHVPVEAIHWVMQKNAFYCFEYQSQDDARRIMRQHQVPYLIVLDHQLRVVGTVWMQDLTGGDNEQKPV